MINLITKNWKIENINSIIFDKDGTIIDSNVYWGKIVELRTYALIDYYNLKISEEKIALNMGYSFKTKKLLERGPVGISSREEVIEKLLRFLQKNKIKSNFKEISDIFVNVHKNFLSEINNYTVVIKDALNFLIKLKKFNIKLILITSDSIINTKKILEYLNISDYFDLIIGKELTEQPKSSGIPAKIALETLNLNPNNCICIGDAPMDYFMALNANLKCAILVSSGQIKYKSLLKYTEFCIKSLKYIIIQ